MVTLPTNKTVEPFGKVTLHQQTDGSIWVRAYVLMERAVEGARTGIAIDGSGTMMPWFGAQRRGAPNIVSTFVQQMCAYLARQLDAAGSTTVIYWATGEDGQAIEEVGTLSATEAETFDFAGPINYGNHTHLLPAVRYFTEQFTEATWGMYLFITDGRLDDLEAVKQYTTELARNIETGARPDLKLVIIGVGRRIDAAQMQALDNLDTGTSLDLWDHKIAQDMEQLAEIFAEVVDAQITIAPQGRVLDSAGHVVRDYRDTGVPALLEFILPAEATSFTLEIGGQQVVQPL